MSVQAKSDVRVGPVRETPNRRARRVLRTSGRKPALRQPQLFGMQLGTREAGLDLANDQSLPKMIGV